jgi:hypothetical protein
MTAQADHDDRDALLRRVHGDLFGPGDVRNRLCR